MGFPKDEGEFYLDADTCNTAIGAVLSQFQDGQLRVIAYGSRKLNKAERKYCITDKELPAVRYFIEYYRQYILGRTFCVQTDHQALIWLFSLKEPKGRIGRWLEILSAFDYSVEYRAGPKHGNADTISRCFNPRDCDCPLTDNLEYLKCGPCKQCKKRAQDMFSSISIPEPFTENILQPETRKQSAEENTWTPWNNGYSRKELQSIQKDDPAIGPILRWKECGSRLDRVELVKDSAATRHYWYLWDSLEITDELLLKQFHRKDGVESYNQFIVRLRLRKEILKNMHDSVISGHIGKKKTKEKLSHRYYWYEMREDISIWISQCEICGANKSSKAPLGSTPLDRMGTDLLGPLPVTPRGNKYILTITDYFTTWVEIFAVPDQTAVTYAQTMLNEVVCRFGCPLAIHSDQGRNLKAGYFKNYARS